MMGDSERRRSGLWWGVLLICMVVLLSCGGCGVWVWVQAQTAEEYLIPADFRGWTVIRYEIPDCLPLRSRGFTRVVVLDSTGRACTSSKPELRPATFHFILVAANGSRQELPLDRRDLAGVQAVWFGSQNDPQIGSFIGRFYVGTYVDAQNAGAPPIR
jgi:hypothetical protein